MKSTLKIVACSSILTVFYLSSAFGMQERSASKGLYGLPSLQRGDFNQLSVQEKLPLYWYEDLKNPGEMDPSELVTIGVADDISKYVSEGKFTHEFKQAYTRIVQAKRKETIKRELAQGRPSILFNDLSALSVAEKDFVRSILEAGKVIEELYQIQNGGLERKKFIPGDDHASLALYKRNQGVWCQAPETENDPFCSADPAFPVKKSDAYPKDLEQDAKMCDMLKNQPNGRELLSPFTVVRKEGSGFKAVPITEVYGPKMKKVASILRKAANYLDPLKEKALREYLAAAAGSFETNYWEKADEAWVRMNQDNSKWYLRIAPDEVYFDPCQEKAGFQVSFALVSSGSKSWKEKLTPLKNEMEKRIADLIGSPYKARDVKFEMPEFIEIVSNFGDARKSLIATVGESLPNWGKIAQEGRGRTVAMTNFYTDPDAVEANRKKASLLFSPATMKYYVDDKSMNNLRTVLHEAAHNLGPYSDYRIDGKNAKELFGGRMASVLEEMKAQTASLWYLQFLKEKGLLSEDELKQAYVSGLFWCFNHISKGMTTQDGNPKPYSQLSAVQAGTFFEDGALKKVACADPLTRMEGWRFEIDFAKMPGSVESLMKKVGSIKAAGDKGAAESLVNNYISGPASKAISMDEIGRRYRSFAKESYYYSVKLD